MFEHKTNLVFRCFFLIEYLHVTGRSGLWWRGREVSLHDLIETTVSYILGQLGEKDGEVSIRSESCWQVKQHLFSETDEHVVPGSFASLLLQRSNPALLCFYYSFIISNISLEMKIVKGVDCCCLKKVIYSLGRPFLCTKWLTKSSDVPSLSSSMDWMREMWTPISRWMPEHSMQVRIPRLVDSHLGSINVENMTKKCVLMMHTACSP